LNFVLQDPFHQDVPEIVDGYLFDVNGEPEEPSHPTAHWFTNPTFNRTGTLLAAGCFDGRCVIWDFETRGLAKILQGHVEPVTAVSWTRQGRHLLTASRDWNCIFWDLKYGMKERVIRFSSPINSAEMHPRDKYASLSRMALHYLTWQVTQLALRCMSSLLFSCTSPNGYQCSDSDGTSMPRSTNICFSKDGDRIYVGTHKGFINVFDVSTAQVRQPRFTYHRHLIPLSQMIISVKTPAGIKQIRIINCADRVIRTYIIKSDTLELDMKFQDIVDPRHWTSCIFSADAEYVIGAPAQKHVHKIYIWDKGEGRLVKMLEGPRAREGLADLWHPVRPIICSISRFGTVFIWTVHYQENWSAFAPDYENLEENIEYIEREDEFDWVDCTSRISHSILIHVQKPENVKKRRIADEDEAVDIINVDRLPADDDMSDGDSMFFLPVRPEPDLENVYLAERGGAMPPTPADQLKEVTTRDSDVGMDIEEEYLPTSVPAQKKRRL
ncbi:WD40-repeat-containing domain protein, partial [Cladochytrium replicatum]